jgi:hypothetical protein
MDLHPTQRKAALRICKEELVVTVGDLRLIASQENGLSDSLSSFRRWDFDRVSWPGSKQKPAAKQKLEAEIMGQKTRSTIR